MIIISSLSPNHANQDVQLSCIRSWHKYGKVFSMNTETEIDQMFLIYNNDISFIKTIKTVRPIFHKNLISINAMIDVAIDAGESLVIINSDIYLDSMPELKQDGVTILSRYDYTNNFEDAKIFEPGFDIFYVPYKFLNIYPPCVYAMGLPFWDYIMAYRALLNNIPVYWPQGQYGYHKLHKTQYNVDEWLRVGEFFKLEFNFPKHLSIGQIATAVLKEIKDNAIKI